MPSTPTRPASDPYAEFVAKVAGLRERIVVLENEKMRMAFELKARRAQTKLLSSCECFRKWSTISGPFLLLPPPPPLPPPFFLFEPFCSGG